MSVYKSIVHMTEYWYAIEVEDDQFEIDAYKLKEMGLCVFQPHMEKLLRKEGIFRLVTVPLFMNHLFVKSKEEFDKFQTKLAFSYKRIAQLTMIEQMILRKLMDDEFVIHQSTGIIQNGETIVESGPLQGFERDIKKIDRHKRFAYLRQDIVGLPLKLGLEITIKK